MPTTVKKQQPQPQPQPQRKQRDAKKEATGIPTYEEAFSSAPEEAGGVNPDYIPPRYDEVRHLGISKESWLKAQIKFNEALCELRYYPDHATASRFLAYIAEFYHPNRGSTALQSGTSMFGPKFDVPFTERDGIVGMVVQSHIPFRMCCAHHLLPAMGYAAIGYLPNRHVCGLSKLARVCDWVATSRPGMQESIGNDIADMLMSFLDPKGVIVVITAEHGCMACRGVTMPNVATTTSTLRGAFRDNPNARQEFFNLIGTNRGRS